MTFSDVYAHALDGNAWKVDAPTGIRFDFDYSDDRSRLLDLYAKGKAMQWDAESRIDWSHELDPDNPNGMPHELLPIFHAPFYAKLDKKTQAEARRHFAAWATSQFLHGEQGALICAARIVQEVPNLESKFYAATQVMDEARHVEAYKKYLEKMGLAYPITPPLKQLLDDILKDSRWDMTYLGMQVVIEGLALAAFANMRDLTVDPLARAVTAYVMQDEARHVAFGRVALKEYYPELTAKERDEREEFLVDACYLMRDRFEANEVWNNLGFPMKECREHFDNSEMMRIFRSYLFSRIVPVVKDIGLWGPRITKAFTDMGVISFGDVDVDSLQRADETIAIEIDNRRGYVDTVIRMAE